MDKITTVINGETTEHEDFESAARYWDSISWQTPITNGAISIKSYDSNGNCVRDANLIHVHDGIVYVNPSLRV